MSAQTTKQPSATAGVLNGIDLNLTQSIGTNFGSQGGNQPQDSNRGPIVPSKLRLTYAELTDLQAQHGDSNVQILLGGTGFTKGLTAHLFDKGLTTQLFDKDYEVEVLNGQLGAIYVDLPDNYKADQKTNYMVELKDAGKVSAGMRHLVTNYVPSGADLSKVLENNRKEAKNLKNYATSAEKLAAARLRATLVQGRLNAAHGAAATANLISQSTSTLSRTDLINPSCKSDSSAESAYVRVRRSVMAPKEASDAFGRRLGRHYIIFQVTVENRNTDYQYMLHNVSVDLSNLMGAPPGTNEWAFSTQELAMLRGVPEKGQDYDPRNLTFHILRSVGSVAGGVTGLTADSIQDIFGGAVAGFNGPFLSSFIDIFPDHTATQLNRLSDSAFASNTLVAKQGAKVFAIFVPASLILNNKDARKYWENPLNILEDPTHDFRNADVCVDGTFITEVASIGVSKVAFVDPALAKPGASVDLNVFGTNLVAGDTILNLFDQNIALSDVNSAKGTAVVTVKLPADYDFQREYAAYLGSSKSGQRSVSLSLAATPQPVLNTVVISDKTKAVKGGKGVLVQVTGGHFVTGDTTISIANILRAPILLDKVSNDGTSAQVTVDLPSDFDMSKNYSAMLQSKSGLVSGAVALSGAP